MVQHVSNRRAAAGIVIAVRRRVVVRVNRRADAPGGIVVGLGKTVVGVGDLGQAPICVVGIAGGVSRAVGRGQAMVLGIVGRCFGGLVGIRGCGQPAQVIVVIAGFAVELIVGGTLLADTVVLDADAGAIGIIGFGQPIVAIVLIAGGDRLLLTVCGASNRLG